jgi:hypothetical protein
MLISCRVPMPEAKASASIGTDFYRAYFASVLRLKPSEILTRRD